MQRDLIVVGDVVTIRKEIEQASDNADIVANNMIGTDGSGSYGVYSTGGTYSVPVGVTAAAIADDADDRYADIIIRGDLRLASVIYNNSSAISKAELSQAFTDATDGTSGEVYLKNIRFISSELA